MKSVHSDIFPEKLAGLPLSVLKGKSRQFFWKNIAMYTFHSQHRYVQFFTLTASLCTIIISKYRYVQIFLSIFTPQYGNILI